MSMKIEVIAATRLSEREFWEASALGRSLARYRKLDNPPVFRIYFDNGKGLSEVYNDAIMRCHEDAALVFVHDDVWLDDLEFLRKIKLGLEQFDVIGVAGNKRRVPGQISWAFVDNKFTWDDKENLSGAVAHGDGPNGRVTEYGPAPATCKLLDGVLLAVKRSVLLESGVRFDPSFQFHFYDLDFCRTAEERGLKLGVWPISITHQSGGAFGTSDWRSMSRVYLDKWESVRASVPPLTSGVPDRGFGSSPRIRGIKRRTPIGGDLDIDSRGGVDPVRGLNTTTQRNRINGRAIIEIYKQIGGNIQDIARSYLDTHKDAISDGKRIELLLEVGNALLDGQGGTSLENDKKAEDEIRGALNIAALLLKEAPSSSGGIKLQNRATTQLQELRYRNWRAMHALKEIDGELFAERMMGQWQSRPVFHFVLFLFPGDEALLGDTLDSLSAQFYQEWRLSVIADSPAPDPLWEEIGSLQWLHCGAKDDPYALANEVIASVESDWISFIEAGTQWPQHALLRVGDYASLHADWSFIYCDVDDIDPQGERGKPRFLPDFNLDMLRSMPYCRQGAWIKRAVLLEVGGIEPLPGCEMVDLALRSVEAGGEESVGHIADILAHAPKGRREPDEAIVALTVKNHLERSGIAAVVGEGYLPRTLRVNYLHAEEAFVSIIIPTRDKYEYIESCVQSVLQCTDYENFEVIIADMGSTDPDALALYEAIEKADEGRVSILRLGADVNVAAACNNASMSARGEYLLFLKNHVEAKQKQWLSRLMLHAQRPEVGVVGPRVVYPESTLLYDAGLVLGMDDVVGKPFASRLTLNGPGYMGRAQIDQNYSAVSDTCLLVRKSLFAELGGMDAERLGKDFLDIDLCLRVRGSGYKVVWTPFSLLLAYKGNATINERGKGREYLEDVVAFEKAREVLLERWLPQIANDPAYNPNLDLSSDNAFVVNDKLPLNWDINFHERTRVLGLPLNGGSGDYRIIQPFDAISDAALQQTEHYRVVKGMGAQLKMAPIVRMDPDVLVVQAGIDDMHVNLLEDLARHKPDIFRVFSLDDLVTEIPEKSSVYKHYTGNFRNARARIRKALSLCDRMIVTTHTLADAYADMIDDIRVIPNRLRRDPWLSLKSRRRVGKKPRVGWVGAQQHAGDLDLIIDVVKQTADKVDWVFMGMCPQEIRPIVAEYDTQWVAYDKYPAKMAALNLDIAVAPLEQHRFNEAKSNLRLLEYGILGWPVVCTDIAPYQSYDAPVRRVANETDAWIGAIMDYANDLDRAAKDGDKLRDWVKRNFILEDHLDEWVNALTPAHHSRDVGESDAFAQGAPVGVSGNSGEADLILG